MCRNSRSRTFRTVCRQLVCVEAWWVDVLVEPGINDRIIDQPVEKSIPGMTRMCGCLNVSPQPSHGYALGRLHHSLRSLCRQLNNIRLLSVVASHVCMLSRSQVPKFKCRHQRSLGCEARAAPLASLRTVHPACQAWMLLTTLLCLLDATQIRKESATYPSQN